MPRHPPCALKNLTQHPHTHHQNTHPKASPPGRMRDAKTKDARVHCAVLKQRVNPRPRFQRLPPPLRNSDKSGSTDRSRPIEQTNPDGFVPSGPNSVPSPTPPHPPFPPPHHLRTGHPLRDAFPRRPRNECAGVLSEHELMKPCRCSTRELHLRGVRPQHGPEPPAPPPHEGGGEPVQMTRCSLERR